jgi:hypothetical protein
MLVSGGIHARKRCMKTPYQFVCPACGLKAGVNIEYGMPTPELFEAAERGEVVLGGCCMELDAPERECLQCNHAWKIKRRGAQPL